MIQESPLLILSRAASLVEAAAGDHGLPSSIAIVESDSGKSRIAKRRKSSDKKEPYSTSPKSSVAKPKAPINYSFKQSPLTATVPPTVKAIPIMRTGFVDFHYAPALQVRETKSVIVSSGQDVDDHFAKALGSNWKSQCLKAEP
eukprot:Colp12_sorted_trinity150504_noHs@30658